MSGDGPTAPEEPARADRSDDLPPLPRGGSPFDDEATIDQAAATRVAEVGVFASAPTRPAPRAPTEHEETAESLSPHAARGTVFGRYVLTEQVGRGGMAEVHLAYERLRGAERLCVIKRIAAPHRSVPDYGVLFADEARVALLLEHPNIVRCFEAGEVEGVAYLALELVDGLNAQHLAVLSRPAGVPPAFALEIAHRIAEALAYAHALSAPDGAPLELVHRDITPHNVLIARDGAVKLADFGIAKYRGRDVATIAGLPKGKLRYMAPEQLRCEAVDARADLFGLGAVLGELLLGAPLFPATVHDVADMDLHLAARALPPDLRALLRLLVALDPAERPANASGAAALIARARTRHPSLVSLAEYVGSALLFDVPRADPLVFRTVVARPVSRTALGAAALPSGDWPAGHPTTVSVLAGAHFPTAETDEGLPSGDMIRAVVRGDTYLRDLNMYLRGVEDPSPPTEPPPSAVTLMPLVVPVPPEVPSGDARLVRAAVLLLVLSGLGLLSILLLR